MRSSFVVVALIQACGGVETLDLPADPAARGSPVGVRTVEAGGETVEIWYPASEGSEGDDDVVFLADVLPDALVDALDPIVPPSFTQAAVRDAPPRRLEDPLPLVVFSHGFGGFRTQSVELTAHLASRGYVVVSADHPGRTLGDVAPCLLSPPPAPCSVGFGTGADDPAIEDVTNVLAWWEDTPDVFGEADLVDLDRVGIFGHSAGGGTTTSVASADPRIDAALALFGAGTFTRELPSAVVGGSCDGIVPGASLEEAGGTSSEGYLSLEGAGHLAPSDLCRADLGALADEIAERPDANGLLLGGLRTLATDGCPGATPSEDLEDCSAFLDLDRSGTILRHSVTAFFDEHLYEAGDGLGGADFEELVRP